VRAPEERSSRYSRSSARRFRRAGQWEKTRSMARQTKRIPTRSREFALTQSSLIVAYHQTVHDSQGDHYVDNFVQHGAASGEKLGSIDDLMIDEYSGAPCFRYILSG
jgi:hypothetical protein